jgi:hypothetical protein
MREKFSPKRASFLVILITFMRFLLFWHDFKGAKVQSIGRNKGISNAALLYGLGLPGGRAVDMAVVTPPHTVPLQNLFKGLLAAPKGRVMEKNDLFALGRCRL